MRKYLIIALLAALGGCVSTGHYGNYLEGSTPAANQKLAADTVKQLTQVYPPASTRFNLSQTTTDGYGAMLVAGLRAKGYSLLEYTPERVVTAKETPTAAISFPGTRAVALRYVVDSLGENNLYRVTLLVGDQSLTRAYVAQNSTVYPAGAWVRKE